jgi:hypothetical protein
LRGDGLVMLPVVPSKLVLLAVRQDYYHTSTRSHLLTVRKSGFHPGNRSSILLGITIRDSFVIDGSFIMSNKGWSKPF